MVYNHSRIEINNLSLIFLNKIESRLNSMAKELDHVRQDILYLSEDELIRHFDQTSNDNDKIRIISKNFSNLISNKKNYDRITFIDNSGLQIIKVEKSRGFPKVKISDFQQTQGLQNHYLKAVSLKQGQVHATPLELSIENDQLEVPVKPVINFSTPVFDYYGNRTGILVIKYLARELLQSFKQSNNDRLIRLMLINSKAYYLSSQQSEFEWSFMFKDDKQYLFSRIYPQAWSQFQVSDKGIINNENGIFAYASISAFSKQLSIEQCDICNWRAIAHIPPESIQQLRLNEIDRIHHVFLIFFLVGSFFLWYIFKNSIRRKDSEKQIAHLNRIVKNERDLFINGPTIVFNWRDQFGWPVDYVSDNIKSVLGYSPSSFIDNDLSYSSIVAPEYLSQIADDLSKARQQNLKSFELRSYQVVDSKGKRVWLRHFSTAIRDNQDNITHYYGYVNDITHIKETEEELKKSRKYVNNLLETLPDPTVVIDIKNYNILLANKSAKALYNNGNPIVEGTTCYQFSHHQNSPCTGSDDPCPIQEIIHHKKSAKVVHRHFVKDGNEIYVELMSRPVFDENGEIVQIIESQRDITHHIINERRLTQQAITDPLTEAYNRLKFDNELIFQLEIALSKPTQLGLIMFDLDNFKIINDTFGHDVGDFVLKDVAGLARDSIRKTDILARWGGEEFMILLPDTKLHIVQKIADNLRHKIEIHLFNIAQHVTASFGVTISDKTDNESEIVKRVDNALYQSKNEGRNRVTTLLKKHD